MNCDDCIPLLHAHADGELDLVRHIEIEEHLKACPACMRRSEHVGARRPAIRESLPRFTAPQQLRDRIHASLRAEARTSSIRQPLRFPGAWRSWNLGGLAASVTFALVAGYSLGIPPFALRSRWRPRRSQSMCAPCRPRT